MQYNIPHKQIKIHSHTQHSIKFNLIAVKRFNCNFTRSQSFVPLFALKIIFNYVNNFKITYSNSTWSFNFRQRFVYIFIEGKCNFRKWYKIWSDADLWRAKNLSFYIFNVHIYSRKAVFVRTKSVIFSAMLHWTSIVKYCFTMHFRQYIFTHTHIYQTPMLSFNFESLCEIIIIIWLLRLFQSMLFLLLLLSNVNWSRWKYDGCCWQQHTQRENCLDSHWEMTWMSEWVRVCVCECIEWCATNTHQKICFAFNAIWHKRILRYLA